MSPTPQQDVVLQQIDTLIRQSGLSRSDILALLDRQAETGTGESGPPGASLLQKVISYIGGAFIFAGICVYIGMVWEDLDSLARVIITLGSGFVVFVLGLFCLGDQRFTRAATPLFVVAAALQPTGLFVFMDEYLPQSGDIALAASFVFGFMLVQQAVAFFACRRTSLLFFALLFFYLFCSAAMNKLEVDSKLTVMTLGLSGIAISWALSRTVHHAITAFYFFTGGLGLAASAFDYLAHTHYDVLMIGVVAVMILVSVRAHSRSLLTVSTLVLLAYLGYFTDEYFKNVVGWPIALVVVGLMMLGISAFAVKLGRRMN